MQKLGCVLEYGNERTRPYTRYMLLLVGRKSKSVTESATDQPTDGQKSKKWKCKKGDKGKKADKIRQKTAWKLKGKDRQWLKIKCL